MSPTVSGIAPLGSWDGPLPDDLAALRAPGDLPPPPDLLLVGPEVLRELLAEAGLDPAADPEGLQEQVRDGLLPLAEELAILETIMEWALDPVRIAPWGRRWFERGIMVPAGPAVIDALLETWADGDLSDPPFLVIGPGLERPKLQEIMGDGSMAIATEVTGQLRSLYISEVVPPPIEGEVGVIPTIAASSDPLTVIPIATTPIEYIPLTATSLYGVAEGGGELTGPWSGLAPWTLERLEPLLAAPVGKRYLVTLPEDLNLTLEQAKLMVQAANSGKSVGLLLTRVRAVGELVSTRAILEAAGGAGVDLWVRIDLPGQLVILDEFTPHIAGFLIELEGYLAHLFGVPEVIWSDRYLSLYPGILQGIVEQVRAHGLPLVVATSKPERSVIERLVHLGVEGIATPRADFRRTLGWVAESEQALLRSRLGGGA